MADGLTLLEPAPGVDIELSLRVFGTSPPSAPGIQKDEHDLLRYDHIIERTKPDVIVECGTCTGHAANWFAQLVPEVITIDCDASNAAVEPAPNVTRIVGDTLDPNVAGRVAKWVRGKRILVSLDSDHTPGHVAEEILLWWRLVPIGCHLVIEDGIYRWKPDPQRPEWDSLAAISLVMPKLTQFERDLEIEGAYPITGSPAGWWIRRR